MSYTIDRSSTKFLCGLFSSEALENWQRTSVINGGVCLCGRSNVGKSSLINALWGDKTAKTSRNPGKTQGIMAFSFNLKDCKETLGPFYLFDLPGYGMAKVSKETKSHWDQLMKTFFDQLGPRIMIVHIRDARHPNEGLDKGFEDFISNFRQKKILVFNKMDKLKGQREKASFHKFLREDIGRATYCLSAKSREGTGNFEKVLLDFLTE